MSEEGTSYTLRIEDEISGLDTTIDKLEATEKLLPKVDAELKGLGASMKRGHDETEKLARAHGKHAQEAKGLEGALHRLVHAGMDPFLHKAKEIAEFEFIRKGVDKLIEAPGEIAEKLVDLGKEVINTAAAAERMDLSFKLTLGQEGAEQVLGFIERISDKTEFTDDQLKGWSSQLLRAGVKAEELDKFIAAGGDVAAKSTNKLEGMSAAISALERAELTGRIEGRALRGLHIGVDELRTLPEYEGLSNKALHEKIEQGSISKDQLFRVIAGKDGVLGDLALQASKTFEAQLKNVKSIPEQIYQGLYKTAGFEKLGSFLTSIYDNFGPKSEAGQVFGEGLSGVLDVLAGKLQTIDLAEVAHEVGSALEQLPEALETTKDLLKDTAAALGILGDGIQAVSKFFDFFVDKDKEKKEANAEFNRTRDPVEVRYEREQREKLYAVREARAAGQDYVDPDRVFGPQEDPLTRASKRKDAIRKELKAEDAEGKRAAEGLTWGALGGGPRIEAAGAGMGDALKRGTNGSLETHSPSRALFRTGAYAAEGFVLGIESRQADIEDAIATAFSPPNIEDAMATAFSPPADGPAVSALAGGGSGGVMLKVDVGGVTIMSAEGADAHELADDFVAALDRVLPGALTKVLEGVRARAGG